MKIVVLFSVSVSERWPTTTPRCGSTPNRPGRQVVLSVRTPPSPTHSAISRRSAPTLPVSPLRPPPRPPHMEVPPTSAASQRLPLPFHHRSNLHPGCHTARWKSTLNGLPSNPAAASRTKQSSATSACFQMSGNFSYIGLHTPHVSQPKSFQSGGK